MSLRISTAPHMHNPLTTQRLMQYVFIALLPTAVWGIYAFGFSVQDAQFKNLQPGSRHQADFFFFTQTAVMDIFPDASGCIAAHFRFASVRIEHPHPEVRLLIRQNQHQSV